MQIIHHVHHHTFLGFYHVGIFDDNFNLSLALSRGREVKWLSKKMIVDLLAV